MFEYCDKVLKDLHRRNVRLFDTLKFDELNVVKTVTKAYDTSLELALKRYLMIAKHIWKKADMDWLLDMLETYDLVTLYLFFPEVERKKGRTMEALEATPNKRKEAERALKLWTLQIDHYAERTVDEATIQKFKADGIKKVKWITAKDEKVCKECNDRDGEIYDIDKIPPRPHYRCRCEWIPVR